MRKVFVVRERFLTSGNTFPILTYSHHQKGLRIIDLARLAWTKFDPGFLKITNEEQYQDTCSPSFCRDLSTRGEDFVFEQGWQGTAEFETGCEERSLT